MNENIKVTKRDGRVEPWNQNKIREVLNYCCEGLSGVSTDTILMNAKLMTFDGITTDEIHDVTIKSAYNLISEYQPNYQYVAGRLLMIKLRKQAYGQYDVPHLYDHVKKMVADGWYDKELLTKYCEKDFLYFNRRLNHEKDMEFAHAAASQFQQKYLVQNRVTKNVLESPQMLYMLVAMCLFQDYPKSTRKGFVLKFYEKASQQKLSLPTPIMAGVRTPQRQFSSCCLIEAGDSLDAIQGADAAIFKYSAARAGIGINGGMLRALGSAIRKGDATHTGAIGFWRKWYNTMASCSQTGIRKGSSTMFFPLFHRDVESFLVLKNNKGTEETRLRHSDYGVQMNMYLLQKMAKNEPIYLFCPHEAVGLYDAFFENTEKFIELYEKYSKDDSVSKKIVSGGDLLSSFIEERAQTSRVYPMFVDNVQNYGPFIPEKAPVRQSNLC